MLGTISAASGRRLLRSSARGSVTHVFVPPNTRSWIVTRTPIRLNNDDTAFNNSRSFLLFAALQWQWYNIIEDSSCCVIYLTILYHQSPLSILSISEMFF